MHKKEGGFINRSQLTMIIGLTIFMVIAFYLGSITTAVAKNKEMANKIEKLEKELNKRENKGESPPLKKKQKKSRSAKVPKPTLKPTEMPESTAKAKSTLKPTEMPESTAKAKSTLKPTETPESTATAKPMLKPTETPESTATAKPMLKPTETPESTATAKPMLKPTETPDSTATPTQLTVEVVNNTQIFDGIEDGKPLKKLQRGDKLNVVEHQYGWLKVVGKEWFVYYLDTNYLDRRGIFTPVYISDQNGQKATVYKDQVELRSKPGFTSQSELIALIDVGERVIIHSIEEMIPDEEYGYCKVTICRTGQKGYIYNDNLDWEMEFQLDTNRETESSKGMSTETFEATVNVSVCRPMKMYRGNYTQSEVIKELTPGEQLFVQECVEANSGWLMAIYNDSHGQVLKGFVQYLNTDYLDRVKRYKSVYQEKLDGLKATINTNSVNLRNRPGITEKSRVVDVRDRGTELLLISYEEVVRYEKHGWYKAIVVETGQTVFICGKYVDVKEKAEDTGSLITAKEERDECVVVDHERITAMYFDSTTLLEKESEWQ